MSTGIVKENLVINTPQFLNKVLDLKFYEQVGNVYGAAINSCVRISHCSCDCDNCFITGSV